jgi:hypothetical protein
MKTRSYIRRLGNWLAEELEETPQQCDEWKQQIRLILDELEDFMVSPLEELQRDINTELRVFSKWMNPDPVTKIFPMAFFQEAETQAENQYPTFSGCIRASLRHCRGEAMTEKRVSWDTLEAMLCMAPRVLIPKDATDPVVLLGKSQNNMAGCIDHISTQILEMGDNEGRCIPISKELQEANVRRLISKVTEAAASKPNFLIIGGTHKQTLASSRHSPPAFKTDLRDLCARLDIEVAPSPADRSEMEIKVTDLDEHMKLLSMRITYSGPDRSISKEDHLPRFVGWRGRRRKAAPGEVKERDKTGNLTEYTSTEMVASILTLPGGTRDMDWWTIAVTVRGLPMDAGFAGMIIRNLHRIIEPTG